MQPADFTAELRPDIYPTLPCLDIQLQWHRASESEVSPECHLDDFDVVPTRKRRFVQCQCLPCDGTRLPAVPYNGRSFRVTHRIPWWCTSTSHRTYHPPGGKEPTRTFTPDVSKLQGIAATSELFKHWDLDATLVVHATERKHEDRYHFYWYFTIPTLVAILLTIMICNSYPYLFRNLLHKIRCTTQPVVNSTTRNKSQSSPEVQPEQQRTSSQLQPNESGKK